MFDVIRFLEDHGIEYDRSREGAVIRCPFCGDEDPSKHLAWNAQNSFWHCWRNSLHAGRKPHRLIMRLTNCTMEAAENLISQGRSLDSFLDTINKLHGVVKEPLSKPRTLELPEDFRPLTQRGVGRYFIDYLIHNRGFKITEVRLLSTNYDLRFCTKGEWRNRVIFPLYLNNRLVSWTGRSISRREKLRYLTLGSSPSNRSQKIALQSTKEIIYGYDRLLLEGGKVLAVCEGPFDALKVDVYGRRFGLRATCLFGTGITEDQADLLRTVSSRFERTVILGDTMAQPNAWRLLDSWIGEMPRVVGLPGHAPDPGALRPSEVETIARSLVR